MTDDELDRLLADAGGVGPPPHFVARVRARLATEPDPSVRWTWPWLAWPATAIAAALAMAMVAQQLAVRRPVVEMPAPADVTVTDAGPSGTSSGPGAGRDRVHEPWPALEPQPVPSPRPDPSPTRPERLRASDSGQDRLERFSLLGTPGPLFSASDRIGFALLLVYSRAGTLPALDATPDVLSVVGAIVTETLVAPLDVPSLVVSSDVTTSPFEGDPQ